MQEDPWRGKLMPLHLRLSRSLRGQEGKGCRVDELWKGVLDSDHNRCYRNVRNLRPLGRGVWSGVAVAEALRSEAPR